MGGPAQTRKREVIGSFGADTIDRAFGGAGKVEDEQKRLLEEQRRLQKEMLGIIQPALRHLGDIRLNLPAFE